MQAAQVIGRVVASRKYESLEGVKLLLIQPLTWDKQLCGAPLVAADTVGAGAKEFVFYVTSREAAVALAADPAIAVPPVDAAILGIIDGVNLQAWTAELKPLLKSNSI